MSDKSTYHSILSNAHHNNPKCTIGSKLGKEHIRQGTGGKPLCLECEKNYTGTEV